MSVIVKRAPFATEDYSFEQTGLTEFGPVKIVPLEGMLRVKRLSYGVLPKKAHPDDAAYDLFSPFEVTLLPGSIVKIQLGLTFGYPKGKFGRIVERSSMGSKGIKVNGGVCDHSYRGEICVVLHNLSDTAHFVNRGDKIAQLLIETYYDYEVVEVEKLDETERGTGGFGSTGK